MELLSIAGFILLLVVVFIVARFVLHLAGRVIGCILTVLIALGILWLLFTFVF
jgi:hypothetical protein